MADNELRRRRLKIIQVLLLVDDLEDEKGRNRERIIWSLASFFGNFRDVSHNTGFFS